MKFQVKAIQNANGGVVAALCPHCGHNGSFGMLGQDLALGEYTAGQRTCPRLSCKGHLFVVLQNGNVIASYPPVRVDFDGSRIPPDILATFEEALDCHAHGLYRSSGMMVRRTLEEICEERGAEGDNLKKRIGDLRSKIVLPTELFDALDDLRLLGNDAAHIEAKTFSKVSKDELDVAIELTKEILKGLYQLRGLMDKLAALKQP